MQPQEELPLILRHGIELPYHCIVEAEVGGGGYFHADGQHSQKQWLCSFLLILVLILVLVLVSIRDIILVLLFSLRVRLE